MPTRYYFADITALENSNSVCCSKRTKLYLIRIKNYNEQSLVLWKALSATVQYMHKCIKGPKRVNPTISTFAKTNNHSFCGQYDTTEHNRVFNSRVVVFVIKPLPLYKYQLISLSTIFRFSSKEVRRKMLHMWLLIITVKQKNVRK